ncbi:MAG TPA: hypothetical protein DD414_07785 [Lachnospiraceae bacterium]|nr:hypothetical protein [Lachnospiraceae bacterium]
MRQYMGSDKRTLEKIVCNQCGQELKLENGIVQEGVFSGDARWGYFSGWDGERHSFDLCEKCYRRLIGSFRLPVTVEEETELL